MVRRTIIDGLQAAALHRTGVYTPKQIAKHYGVCLQAVYRAFKRANYYTDNMVQPGDDRLPQSRPHAGRRTTLEILASAPTSINREPCPYCGVRADFGCKHQTRLDWHCG